MASNERLASLQLEVYCGGGLLAGIIAHQGVFIRGEWHVQSPAILATHGGLFLCLWVAKAYISMHQVDVALWMSYCYIFSLVNSIVLYRVFFHPLTRAGFRGPWYARITKLWHVWAARKSKNHLVLAKLHEKYGEFVRTGPAEITVFHPEVFQAVDGPRTECIKAEWYDILHPEMALVTARSKEIHAARRREWKRGFTPTGLAHHETKMLKYVDQLDQCIERDARASRPSHVNNLFFWFSFDAMGDFVFNQSFGMLHDQRWHHIIVRLQTALSLLGPFSPVPWLIQVGFKLAPRLGPLRDWFDMVAWCESQMRTRLADGYLKQPSPDLTHYLMEQEDQTKDAVSLTWLQGDSLLAIVAGSEPTAMSLIGVFCELAKYPQHADIIYDELINAGSGSDEITTDRKILCRLKHLNAVLNESLRLYPALPTGGARKSTKNGVTIGGNFIPPHTTIIAPRFSIFRMEECFDRPNEFIPERWTTRPEMVRNIAAFSPFGTGDTSCLGRALATDTMRFVTARLVKKYRFRLPPGETGCRVLDDMRDQFTSISGRLTLSFELR
ncbi:cytochrome P450 [Pseudomassariella vexata]|uniref:Cytochrome P450 n=1 Tax=Pseudomassariella vexata TaxID=1141098 RepID=A0A1Y2E687_9PEZI|nr:cytochrome P450 [Pseudomassariella vexata]ORY67019.1 cytochrome P450 [Pseudomassariella vexata]